MYFAVMNFIIMYSSAISRHKFAIKILKFFMYCVKYLLARCNFTLILRELTFVMINFLDS